MSIDSQHSNFGSSQLKYLRGFLCKAPGIIWGQSVSDQRPQLMGRSSMNMAALFKVTYANGSDHSTVQDEKKMNVDSLKPLSSNWNAEKGRENKMNPAPNHSMVFFVPPPLNGRRRCAQPFSILVAQNGYQMSFQRWFELEPSQKGKRENP